MSDLIGKLRGQTTTVCQNLRIASVCFDTAWTGNEQEDFGKAVNGTYSNHVHRLVFSSLVQRAVSSLLISVSDKTKSYACVAAIQENLAISEIRRTICSKISEWPSIAYERDRVKRSQQTLDDLLKEIRLDMSLIRPHLASLNSFRNREIAHAAIEMKRNYPTFNEVAACVRLGDNIRQNLRLIVMGESMSPEEDRDIWRRYSLHYFQAISLGLRTGSEKLEPAELGFNQRIVG
ncbi:MAG: hypothetical protein KDA73_16905 [Rhodobacteraceae bacterium]|nr:hypothetical protein [Paracoccaceae bacterium]